MRRIPDSELIINQDGSIFHLHIKPENLAHKIIMMGDPARVDLTASFFDSIEHTSQNREFKVTTGIYRGKRITAMSHGIGPDNIDIVMTELDALVNINLETREVKKEHTTLEIVRVGTSGGMQDFCTVGSWVVANRSIGFDGVLNYYAGRNSVCDLSYEETFKKFTNWNTLNASPYVVMADNELVQRIGYDMILGTTISAIGFYGPQGRYVRLPLANPTLNEKIEKFICNGEAITNYEMESAPLAGLSKLLGHKAMTICTIIANRLDNKTNVNYKESIVNLMKTVLNRI